MLERVLGKLTAEKSDESKSLDQSIRGFLQLIGARATEPPAKFHKGSGGQASNMVTDG